MRIIKQGKLPSEKIYTATCRNCNTEIEFQMCEADYISDQRDGDCLRIECPLCKQFIWKSV